MVSDWKMRRKESFRVPQPNLLLAIFFFLENLQLADWCSGL